MGFFQYGNENLMAQTHKEGL